jgi:hypothetical protein
MVCRRLGSTRRKDIDAALANNREHASSGSQLDVFLPLLVFLAVVVLISIRVCTMPVPWWYELTFLTLGPLSVLIIPGLWAINSEH